MALFRVDFSGRGELSERQQKVTFARTLTCIADDLSKPAACPGTFSSDLITWILMKRVDAVETVEIV